MENSFIHSHHFKAILLILALLFVWQVWHVFALLILALAIASALDGPVDWLERHRWPRILAATLMYVVFVAVVALFLTLVLPSFVRELGELGQQLPSLYEKFLKAFRSLERFGTPGKEAFQQFSEFVAGAANRLLGSLLDLLEGLTSFVVVVVLSFYLLVRKDGVSDFLRLLAPVRFEPYILDLWSRTNRKLGRWLQGQLLLALLVGVIVYTGLKLAHVPFALALAVLAGAFELVPLVGPVIAAVPAVIYGFLQSPALGLFLLAFYFLVQQIENHLIVPALTRKMTGLNPVIVILALIVGGKLGGILGLLVAIPVTVGLAELLNDLAARKRIT